MSTREFAELSGPAAASTLTADSIIVLDVWRLAPLAYTKSNEHHWAVGTMWIGWDTLMRTLMDIGQSVASTRNSAAWLWSSA